MRRYILYIILCSKLIRVSNTVSQLKGSSLMEHQSMNGTRSITFAFLRAGCIVLLWFKVRSIVGAPSH